MTYLATIRYKENRHSETFPTIVEAEHWLDSMNTNCENTTIIETYDENWNKIDGFFYTEAKR